MLNGSPHRGHLRSKLAKCLAPLYAGYVGLLLLFTIPQKDTLAKHDSLYSLDCKPLPLYALGKCIKYTHDRKNGRTQTADMQAEVKANV